MLIKFFNIKLTLIFTLLFIIWPQFASSEQKMMIVVIDGARYSETFGDTTKTYTPAMWNLAQHGTFINTFYNDSISKTYRAVPALWCGTWTAVRDTHYNGSDTQYAVKPSIFEYYRKQKNSAASDCYYVLKYISSLWLPSFDPSYGAAFWPEYHSHGSNDNDVANQTKWIMDTYNPHFIWVYLAGVDGAGHSGNWSAYINAIQKADSIVGVFWDKLQSDPFYKDSTTFFVTNDHGRHDDMHGGFQHHGCGCEGCRHIQFLALGPAIKENHISNRTRNIPDMAVTASFLLDINPEYADGNVMYEIISMTEIQNKKSEFPALRNIQVFPNPFNKNTVIKYSISKPGRVMINIYNLAGQKIKTLLNSHQTAKNYSVVWNGKDEHEQNISSGLYFLTIRMDGNIYMTKMILLK